MIGVVWLAPLFAWLATPAGIAVVGSATTLGAWYMFSDTITDVSSDIFGDSDNPDHKQNGTLIAVALIIGMVGFLVSQIIKIKPPKL